MKLSTRLSLIRQIGASAHEPRHSVSISVKRPSGVVSPKSMPSFCFRYSPALSPSRSAHGRQVQTPIFQVPTYSRLYMLYKVATS